MSYSLAWIVGAFVAGSAFGSIYMAAALLGNYRKAMDGVFDLREELEDRLCELESVGDGR